MEGGEIQEGGSQFFCELRFSFLSFLRALVSLSAPSAAAEKSPLISP